MVGFCPYSRPRTSTIHLMPLRGTVNSFIVDKVELEGKPVKQVGSRSRLNQSNGHLMPTKTLQILSNEERGADGKQTLAGTASPDRGDTLTC